MKRITLALVLALLAACGGSSGGTTTEQAPTCDEMQAQFDEAFYANDEATMDQIYVAMVEANCNPD